MYSVAAQRQIFIALIGVLLLVILVSCSDTDREPDVPSGTGSGTQSTDAVEATPDPGSTEEEQEATPDSNDITPEISEDSQRETPDGEGLPEPQMTGTPLPLAERTVTPGQSTTGPVGEIFPDIRSQGPELENYTLTLVGELSSTTETDGEPQNVDLTIEQIAPDTFHLLFEGAGGAVPIEVWSVDGQTWIREEGGISEAPEGFEDSFDVGVYLSMLPDIYAISDAEEAGEEEIAGRTTTHYSIAAEDAVEYLPSVDTNQIEQPEGSIEIWLDEENDIVLRMITDLTWLDSEGNEQSNQSEYNVSSIDETAEIDVPTE